MGTLIRSRECFYKEYIENIEIFKIAEEKRGTKKEIKSLFDKNNKPTDDKNLIIQIILDFYSELYTSDGFHDQEVDEYLGKIELNKLNEEDWGINRNNENGYNHVNGQLTEEILITRSVRQGCPLSINLYALAIEILASSIRTNKNIKGINILNLKDPIKLFQHADDCTTITTDIKDYYLFRKEFEKFGKASGAKINKNKTEILNICNAPEEYTCLKFLRKRALKH
ncbi:unnamed protein product [Mytilus coruscus]|uniref:Reverse transcriptase domain-containing protein n=1 Tax=Mytilus coruscus TaxID=42192 RepID=A0A6J8ESU4_MYTCO|nr:unnamed protein product [Mytilus coruscus]